jgi:hypothetical protein
VANPMPYYSKVFLRNLLIATIPLYKDSTAVSLMAPSEFAFRIQGIYFWLLVQ